MNKMTILFIILMIVPTIQAREMGYMYGDNTCEIIAKDYQAIHGGSIIWIQPLQDNGAYRLGKYSAHIMNRVGNDYYDYNTDTHFKNLKEVSDWYYNTTGRKSEIFDLSIKRPPFRMIWHFGVSSFP